MLAGAQFFVTPSLNLKTIEIVKRYSKAMFPGALTPTEIVAAWEAGADAVKVFPCSALGGAKYIKALRGPLPHIEMVPTGGVNLDTVGEFLAAGCCAVGVGSELVDAKNAAAGNYDVFVERARQFRKKIQEGARSEVIRPRQAECCCEISLAFETAGRILAACSLETRDRQTARRAAIRSQIGGQRDSGEPQN